MFQRVIFYGAYVKCANFCIFYVVFMWCFGVWFLLFCSSVFCLVLFFQNNQTSIRKTSFWLVIFYYWFNVKCIGILFGLYFVVLVYLVIIYCLLFKIASTQSINVQQIAFYFIQKCFIILFVLTVGVRLFLG